MQDIINLETAAIGQSYSTLLADKNRTQKFLEKKR